MDLGSDGGGRLVVTVIALNYPTSNSSIGSVQFFQ